MWQGFKAQVSIVWSTLQGLWVALGDIWESLVDIWNGFLQMLATLPDITAYLISCLLFIGAMRLRKKIRRALIKNREWTLYLVDFTMGIILVGLTYAFYTVMGIF